jgi:hypothetical protein
MSRHDALRIACVIGVALMLVPAGAHLMELPNKLRLGPDAYLTVQQIYRGWSLSGIVVVPTVVATVGLAVLDRRRPRVFPATALAAACVVAGHALFWSLTFPVNRATANWTTLPEHWERLRAQWEFSHAAGAVLSFTALALLVWSQWLGRDDDTSASRPVRASPSLRA